MTTAARGGRNRFHRPPPRRPRWAMTDKARITIVTAVTALFLAATSAAGLLAHSHTQPPAAPPGPRPRSLPGRTGTDLARE